MYALAFSNLSRKLQLTWRQVHPSAGKYTVFIDVYTRMRANERAREIDNSRFTTGFPQSALPTRRRRRRERSLARASIDLALFYRAAFVYGRESATPARLLPARSRMRTACVIGAKGARWIFIPIVTSSAVGIILFVSRGSANSQATRARTIISLLRSRHGSCIMRGHPSADATDLTEEQARREIFTYLGDTNFLTMI
jgi:hypothetical protein